ncbi:hypothetical protein SBA6_930023 [Candidatus Sulfopaludibacter sp. SbA6]|nr:hypothetical protein SBA6_930023 [Candidatus Sulfopaludibacter sp. SbA6]
MIACDFSEMDGFGDGFTPEEIAVGPEARFPFRRVFNLRYDYDLGHVLSP